MPNSIIYACGDYVKLKSLRQCNGLRNKNPIDLAVGVSRRKDTERYLKKEREVLIIILLKNRMKDNIHIMRSKMGR